MKRVSSLFLLGLLSVNVGNKAFALDVVEEFLDGSSFNHSTLRYHTVGDDEGKEAFIVARADQFGNLRKEKDGNLQFFYLLKSGESPEASDRCGLWSDCDRRAVVTEATFKQQVGDTSLTLKRCIGESKVFFSQWPLKTEHIIQVVRSLGVYEITLATTLAPDFYRLFSLESESTFSKPSGESCPAESGLGRIAAALPYVRTSHFETTLRGIGNLLAFPSSH